MFEKLYVVLVYMNVYKKLKFVSDLFVINLKQR